MFKEIEEDVKRLLMDKEEVLFVAEQSRMRPGGSLATPNTLYITNRRVIFRNPQLFGLKKDYIDVDYRDISNIRMKKGLFTTEIYLTSRFLSDEVKLPALDKQEAEQVNSLIRKGIEIELPRQLVSEQKTAPAIIRAEKEDAIQKLEKLAKLKDAGIISEEEFQAKKKELMNEI